MSSMPNEHSSAKKVILKKKRYTYENKKVIIIQNRHYKTYTQI